MDHSHITIYFTKNMTRKQKQEIQTELMKVARDNEVYLSDVNITFSSFESEWALKIIAEAIVGYKGIILTYCSERYHYLHTTCYESDGKYLLPFKCEENTVLDFIIEKFNTNNLFIRRSYK